MTTETAPTTDEKHLDPDTVTMRAALNEYFRDEDEVRYEDKPRVYPEVHRFVQWIGEEKRVKEILASEVAQFSETYRSNASEDKKAMATHVKTFVNYLKKHNYTTQALASHIRVRPRSRTTQSTNGVRRRQTEVLVTQQEHDRMQEDLERFKKETIEIAEEIHRAAASGDVRENAPLEAAREKQGTVQANIRRLESDLRFARVLDESEIQYSKVGIGSMVTISRIDSDKQQNVRIADSSVANPLNGTISDISPVGKALMGKKPGDVVKVSAPNNKQLSYKVVSIGEAQSPATAA